MDESYFYVQRRQKPSTLYLHETNVNYKKTLMFVCIMDMTNMNGMSVLNSAKNFNE